MIFFFYSKFYDVTVRITKTNWMDKAVITDAGVSMPNNLAFLIILCIKPSSTSSAA
jgi:hypothetical protein